jgi:hypothetical protein
MKEPQSLHEYAVEITATILAFVKCSKVYIFFLAFASWFFSTYPIEDILLLFGIMTCLDTLTKIHAVAKSRKIPFNPFRKIFWLQIESPGLKLMGRKIFLDYSIPVLVIFCIDTLVFKNAIHFDLLTLKLSPPSAAILFFTGVEFWSIFENIEEAGGVNWLKKASYWFSGFLPEKWQEVLRKIKSKKSSDEE